MQKDDNDKDIVSRIEKWFEELDRFNSDPFLPDREQRTTPERQIFNESIRDWT
jgi:hypothetical protein